MSTAARGREKLGLLGRLWAYHLQTNVYALVLLSVLTGLSVWMYAVTEADAGFASNLWLAVATSLMASVLVLLCETVVKYRSHREDVFLEGIAKLGISNLHFDKRALLSEMLHEARGQFWAVGYRHILTAALSTQLEQAVRRGVRIRLLAVPPWSESFRLVYGTQERVAENYLNVLRAIVRGSCPEESAGPSVAAAPVTVRGVEVRFVDKPLFNDTYRVDDAVVTGPYMHNTDPLYGKLSANDFFTYELHRSSRLHGLVLDEFEVLWEAAEQRLDFARATAILETVKGDDLNDGQKLHLIQDACEEIRSER